MAASAFFLLALLFLVAFAILSFKKISASSTAVFEDKKKSDKKEKLKSK
jgi:uncharacterized protein YpmS